MIRANNEHTASLIYLIYAAINAIDFNDDIRMRSTHFVSESSTVCMQTIRINVK